MTHHLALTGPPDIGKTTYVKKLINGLKERGVHCHGFITEEVREKGRRVGFDVVTLDGKRGILSRNNLPLPASGQRGSQPCVGQYVVDINSFEQLTLPLLAAQVPKNTVFVLDEIGKMEMFSSKFVTKVRELMNKPQNPLIVTIPVNKGRPIQLVEEIRHHKDFRVHTVTRLNRDDVSVFEDLIGDLMKNVSK